MSSRQLKRYWTLSVQHKFLSRFSQLLEQGFSLAQALEVMATLFKPEVIQEMILCCARGISFASTLESCQFEKRIIYIIRSSEEAGSLLQGLKKASDYSEYQLKSKHELNKKLRYPCFLFILIMIILAGVYFFFFPQLDQFYQSFNLEGDKSLLNLILSMIGATLFLFLSIFLFIFVVLKWNHPIFQAKVKTFLFHCPLLKSLLQRIFSYYFSSQWLVFLNCGLPMKKSLSLMQEFEDIYLIQTIIDEFQKQLELGISLETVIEKSPYFTPYFKLIMKHSLEIGQVPAELNHYTKNEIINLSNGLNQAFKIIQTTFLILIGIIICLIYLSLLQPVFQMTELI